MFNVICVPTRAFGSYEKVPFCTKVAFLAISQHFSFADYLHGVDLFLGSTVQIAYHDE